MLFLSAMRFATSWPETFVTLETEAGQFQDRAGKNTRKERFEIITPGNMSVARDNSWFKSPLAGPPQLE